MTACAKARQPEKVLELMVRMQQHQLVPDVTACAPNLLPRAQTAIHWRIYVRVLARPQVPYGRGGMLGVGGWQGTVGGEGTHGVQSSATPRAETQSGLAHSRAHSGLCTHRRGTATWCARRLSDVRAPIVAALRSRAPIIFLHAAVIVPAGIPLQSRRANAPHWKETSWSSNTRPSH